MSEWKKVKLGECCEITSSKRCHASERSKEGIPFYCSKEIIQLENGEEVRESDYIPVELYESIKHKYGAPKQGDLLLTTRGTNGIPYVYKDKDCFYFADGNLSWFKNFKTELSVRFLYYWFKSYIGKHSIDSIAKGTAQKAVPIEGLRNLEIELPTYSTQCRIATILSRYDSLIENYQKQIKLLEESAQRLYKEWFIDLRFPGHENTKIVNGVPNGWEKKSIADLGTYLNGFAFKPSDWQERGKPIIKIKEMGNGISTDTPRNNGERVPEKYLIKSGDLLFSWSATLMVIVWTGEEGWLNQHLFKVTPTQGIGREFLLQSISKTIAEFSNLTTGSTMKHIQRNKLEQVFVNTPTSEIMNSYCRIAERQREQILNISSQIHHLTEARDRLLPKLMSGEI